MANTVITEFDAVKITNASIQFFKNGAQQPGTKFGCIGSISGETESSELVKRCEGIEAKKITIPQKMNLTLSAHIPVDVARSIFGIKGDGLKENVFGYGSSSLGDTFTFTADVIDEFENVTKLIAFPNCSNAGGFSINIENGQDEVAELELNFTALVDANKYFYYEAFTDEVASTISTAWHTQFTPELVASAPIVP